MKIKHKKTGEICDSNEFNIHSLNEIIVYGEDWMDSDFMDSYDILIGTEWIDIKDAFKNRLIVPNNENTRFGVPLNDINKSRGYN